MATFKLFSTLLTIPSSPIHCQCCVLTSNPHAKIEKETAGATAIRVTSTFVSHRGMMLVNGCRAWFTKQFSQHALWCDGDVSALGIYDPRCYSHTLIMFRFYATDGSFDYCVYVVCYKFVV